MTSVVMQSTKMWYMSNKVLAHLMSPKLCKGKKYNTRSNIKPQTWRKKSFHLNDHGFSQKWASNWTKTTLPRVV